MRGNSFRNRNDRNGVAGGYAWPLRDPPGEIQGRIGCKPFKPGDGFEERGQYVCENQGMRFNPIESHAGPSDIMTSRPEGVIERPLKCLNLH